MVKKNSKLAKSVSRSNSYKLMPNLFSFLFLGILIVFFTLSGIYFFNEFPERSTALWLFSVLLFFLLSWMNVYHIDKEKFVVRKIFFPKNVEIPLKSIKKVEVRKVWMHPGLIAAVLVIKAEKDYYFEISVNYGPKRLGKFLDTLKKHLGKKIIIK